MDENFNRKKKGRPLLTSLEIIVISE